MTFLKEFNGYYRQGMAEGIDSCGPADVERALATERLSRADFMALLSPAAAAYLEPLAQRAHRLTRQRFGNIVGPSFDPAAFRQHRSTLCPPLLVQ